MRLVVTGIAKLKFFAITKSQNEILAKIFSQSRNLIPLS